MEIIFEGQEEGRLEKGACLKIKSRKRVKSTIKKVITKKIVIKWEKSGRENFKKEEKERVEVK